MNKPRIPKETPQSYPVGRDNETGRLIPIKEAVRDPRGSTIERMPKPGYGDTKPRK